MSHCADCAGRRERRSQGASEMTTSNTPNVLNQLTSCDGRVTWQARVSQDRGRLEVVGVVAPSSEPTEIEPLSDVDLRGLLAGAPTARDEQPWVCLECRVLNEPTRRWCRCCSGHGR